MVLASTILLLSSALFFFYCQAVCQRILRREFDQEYSQFIVNANRLEFLSVRSALEDFNSPADYARFRMMLQCDYLALTYLLRTAASKSRRHSREEWFLMLYFQWTLVALSLRHLFRLGEKQAMLKLTTILRYFANELGQRVRQTQFASVSASDYSMNG